MRLILFLFVPLAQQDHFEGDAEVFVTQCIAHRVHCTIHIAQPVSQSPKSHRDTVITKCIYKDHDVIWSPGDDEGKEDGT